MKMSKAVTMKDARKHTKKLRTEKDEKIMANQKKKLVGKDSKEGK